MAEIDKDHSEATVGDGTLERLSQEMNLPQENLSTKEFGGRKGCSCCYGDMKYDDIIYIDGKPVKTIRQNRKNWDESSDSGVKVL